MAPVGADLSVEAPPSLRPAKKYCDVTGLLVSLDPGIIGDHELVIAVVADQIVLVIAVTSRQAPYTDPKTSLRYHSAEIYEVIKTFAPGIDQAYLALRGRHQALM